MKLWQNSQCIILDLHAQNQQEIIFLLRVCLRFYFWQNTIARVPSQSQNKPRACQNSTKLWGHSQCINLDVHAKNQQEIIFLWRVCLRFRSWQKRNCTRFSRKLKIKRGLVKMLRNFMDSLNVLFGKSMQKISR